MPIEGLLGKQYTINAYLNNNFGGNEDAHDAVSASIANPLINH